MTSQQSADAALKRWQELRELEPLERIDILVREFFLPAHEIIQNRVAEIMENG